MEDEAIRRHDYHYSRLDRVSKRYVCDCVAGSGAAVASSTFYGRDVGGTMRKSDAVMGSIVFTVAALAGLCMIVGLVRILWWLVTA